MTDASGARTMIVVGGGEMVESVRRFDRVHRLSDKDMHWLCVDLLEQTAQLASLLMPELAVIENARALAAFENGRSEANVAAIVKEVERPARLRLGQDALVAELTPLEILERYFEVKQIPPERVPLLMDRARALLAEINEDEQ